MRLTNLLRIILGTLLISTLLSCAQPELKKPIIETCVETTDAKAFCVKTYVNTEREVSASDWEKERKQRISIRVNDLESIFKLINKACEKEFKCTEEKEKLQKILNMLKAEMAYR
jgi:hypothetical protein